MVVGFLLIGYGRRGIAATAQKLMEDVLE